MRSRCTRLSSSPSGERSACAAASPRQSSRADEDDHALGEDLAGVEDGLHQPRQRDALHAARPRGTCPARRCPSPATSTTFGCLSEAVIHTSSRNMLAKLGILGDVRVQPLDRERAARCARPAPTARQRSTRAVAARPRSRRGTGTRWPSRRAGQPAHPGESASRQCCSSDATRRIRANGARPRAAAPSNGGDAATPVPPNPP